MKLPRFTLRDLFWLVLVCALGLGWRVDRAKLNATANAVAHDWRQQNELLHDALDRGGLEVVVREEGDAGFRWELAPQGSGLDYQFRHDTFDSAIPQQ